MIGAAFYPFIFGVYLIHAIHAIHALNSYQRRDSSVPCPPALVTNDIHPYGVNIPRVNPDYCIGFTITHPVKPGLVYDSGSLQKIAWKVEESKLDQLPESIYRIRVLDSSQRNQAILGENMTIFTTNNYSGEATFPMEVLDEEGEYHYRVMVVYPNQTVHCVFESVHFVIKPSTLARYSPIGVDRPSYALPQWIKN
ncbi:unnamed protein product [Absidia cylindrospora]